MTADGFALFDTTIGRCAIAWGDRGVVAVQLPEARDSATRACVLQRAPDVRETPPPAAVQRAADGIVALLRGEATDLSFIDLDMERVPPFHRRVYKIARSIPPGSTLTYGEIAARLGAPGSARAVGQALGRNPFAIIVPCHRVVAAGGKVSGFSSNGGIATKLRLLSIEGAQPGGAPALLDGDGSFSFDPSVAVEYLRATDPQLATVIDTVGPFAMRLSTTRSLFGALAEAIVYQQLNGRAAATIYARMCALFPQALEGPSAQQLLRVSHEQLRAAGLSRSKIASLRDLAERTVAGDIPTLAEAHHLGDDAIVEQLTQVRGVGRWTAEMLLMFRLGRLDVLPADDYSIRKGFAAAFATDHLPTRNQVEERGALWKPYRTVASWYLWRAGPGKRTGKRNRAGVDRPARPSGRGACVDSDPRQALVGLPAGLEVGEAGHDLLADPRDKRDRITAGDENNGVNAEPGVRIHLAEEPGRVGEGIARRQDRSLDGARVPPLGVAVPAQHVQLVRDLRGVGGEQVAGVRVTGDQPQRLALPFPTDEDRRGRLGDRPRLTDRLSKPVVAALERAVVVAPHLPADLQRLLQAFEPLGHGRERHPQPAVLPLIPGSADPELSPATRQHIQGGDDFGQQTRMAVSHPGNQQPECDRLSMGSHETQRGVALQHRISDRHPFHLKPMIHQRDRRHPRVLRGLGGARQGWADRLGRPGPGETHDMDADTHGLSSDWDSGTLDRLVRRSGPMRPGRPSDLREGS